MSGWLSRCEVLDCGINVVFSYYLWDFLKKYRILRSHGWLSIKLSVWLSKWRIFQESIQKISQNTMFPNPRKFKLNIIHPPSFRKSKKIQRTKPTSLSSGMLISLIEVSSIPGYFNWLNRIFSKKGVKIFRLSKTFHFLYINGFFLSARN